METVTPVDVVQKDSGWYDIQVEDGRTLSTKSRQFSDVMFAKIGEEVSVEVNTRKNGSFTNHYLNKVEGVAEERRSAGTGRKRSSGGGPSEAERADRDKRIAAQWALGRAVELYCADHPLTTGDAAFEKISATAEKLLQAAKSLS